MRLKGQLAPLEEQREKAIAYVSEEERLEDVETALLAVEIGNAKCSVESSPSRSRATARAISANRSPIRKAYKWILRKTRVKLEARNEELDAKQERIRGINQKVEQLDGQSKVFEQRRQFAERSDEGKSEALAAALRELEEVEEKLTLLEKNQVERKVELKNVERGLEPISRRLDQLSQSNEGKR